MSSSEVPATAGAQTDPQPAFTPGRFAGRTVTWLLSDDASNVSGAALPSDGGWSAI